MRIAPPEAPASGYNFGKGVYFADLAGKSVNYCRTYQSNGIGLLLLAEVACGVPRQLGPPDHNAANLPAGTHCTQAVGRRRPKLDGSTYIESV